MAKQIMEKIFVVPFIEMLKILIEMGLEAGAQVQKLK